MVPGRSRMSDVTALKTIPAMHCWLRSRTNMEALGATIGLQLRLHSLGCAMHFPLLPIPPLPPLPREVLSLASPLPFGCP